MRLTKVYTLQNHKKRVMTFNIHNESEKIVSVADHLKETIKKFKVQ